MRDAGRDINGVPFDSFGSFAPAVSNPEGAKLTRTISVVLLNVNEKGTEVASSNLVGGVLGAGCRSDSVSLAREKMLDSLFTPAPEPERSPAQRSAGEGAATGAAA